MELRDFLSRLQGVQDKGNGQYMARCPCHNDKRQSLSVAMGEDKIVVKCFADCAYEDILRAVGVDWKDMMRPEALEAYMEKKNEGSPAKGAKKTAAKSPKPAALKPQPPKEKKLADLQQLRVGGEYVHKVTTEDGKADLKRETITHQYDYVDRAGKPILRVFRTVDKSFPVIHRDGQGWFWGDGGHTNILYKLPQVEQGILKGEPVYLVEGEKDVDTLCAMGYVATTNKGGAGKWSDELTKIFDGAVVYIVPDVDEPGRKHARNVARALDGVAKEVRIVNLLRQKDAELPGKGDISDLVAALGADRARTVLEQLVLRSPVLSRRVTDADYEDYFEGIKGCIVQNACINTLNQDGSTRQLSNFVALPVEQIVVDDGSSKQKINLRIKGWSATGMPLSTVTIPVSQFDGMKWPLDEWGIYASISEGNGSTQKLRRIIQEAGVRSIVHRVTYSHTGWRMIDGKLCFLHGGGAIGADDVHVQLDFGLEQYRLDGIREGEYADMSREAVRPIAQGTTLRVMRAPGLRIGVPVVGFMFLTPLRFFLEKRGHRPSFIPYLCGTTGSGKTTYTSLCMNHFGYDFSYEGSQPAGFDDSMAAMAQKLFVLKDLPLFVDDYKRESEAQRMRSRLNLEETIIRMIGDGLKRSRMTSELVSQTDRPARGLCVQTGEEVPAVTPSSVARLYVIDLKAGEVPVPNGRQDPKWQEKLQEMSELWKLAREGVLNESMRGYIEWLAAQGDDLPLKLEARLEEYRLRAAQDVKNAHSRMPAAVAYMMVGVRMMLDYMTSPGSIFADEPEGAEILMEQCWDAVLGNSEAQVRSMRAERPTQVFLTTVRELLQSKRCNVMRLGEAKLVTPPGLIGYMDEQRYYIIPGEALAAVQKSLDAQDMPLAIGKTTLLRQLREEGLSVPGPGGETLQQIKRGGIHGRFLVLPRHVLEDRQPEVQMEQVDMLAVVDPDNPFGGGSGE